ncbi:hypothetical protein [Haladaptatus sp. W1]|uniref:hypothetical protein n=1 Tax=Haladaptatus sp. W1 TaxID=1897478 RepID=UPI001586F663|nr:hypothetical protein [Haladaptatus sp. W1]
MGVDVGLGPLDHFAFLADEHAAVFADDEPVLVRFDDLVECQVFDIKSLPIEPTEEER